MKKIKKILFSLSIILIGIFCLTTNVYAQDPDLSDESSEETLKARGVFVVSAAHGKIEIWLPKGSIPNSFDDMGVQKWFRTNKLYDGYEEWIGTGTTHAYPGDDGDNFDRIVFDSLDYGYDFFRVYVGGLVMYFNTSQGNTQMVYTLKQDEDYMDKYGSIKVTWENTVKRASKYHLRLKRGSNVIEETDVEIGDRSYIFEKSKFGFTYTVEAYPYFGTEEDGFYYDTYPMTLDDIAGYLSVNDLTIPFENKTIEWTGKKVYDEKFLHDSRDGEKYALESSDYKYTRPDNEIGQKEGVLEGKDHLVGTRNIKYTIVQRNLANQAKNRITGVDNIEYTGHAIHPEITVEMLPEAGIEWYNRIVLSSDNYDVTYGDNVQGVGSVTVTGKNNCKGSLTKTFLIKNDSSQKYQIAETNVSGLVAKKYTGEEIFEEGMVVKYQEYLLEEGTDYTAQYTNNIDAGTATITITGIGNFEGVKTVTFTIKPKEIKPTIKLSASSFVWNNKAQKPTVTVYDDIKQLPSSQYTVKFASGRKNVGAYLVTVTMKKNYKGTGKTTFSIIPKSTSISKFKTAKKAFTVYWKKLSTSMPKKITGYQIQYSVNSNFSGAKSIKVSGYSNTNKKITKLSAKKKYYVRVRTYSKVGTKTFYSKWSSVKSVKTK